MPRNTANEFSRVAILQHGQRVAWVIAIVIPAEYPGPPSLGRERGTEVIPDELDLLARAHRHAGFILCITRLILRRHRGDADSILAHRPNISYKITRISRLIFRPQFPPIKLPFVFIHGGADHGVAMIMRPGFIARISRSTGTISTSPANRSKSPRSKSARPAPDIAVRKTRPAEIGRPDAEPKTAEADRVFRTPEQLGQQVRANIRRQCCNKAGAAPRQGKPEPIDFLVAPAAIHCDRDRDRYGGSERKNGIGPAAWKHVLASRVFQHSIIMRGAAHPGTGPADEK